MLNPIGPNPTPTTALSPFEKYIVVARIPNGRKSQHSILREPSSSFDKEDELQDLHAAKVGSGGALNSMKEIA